MHNTELNVVTGAFNYTGKYIARQLLSMGKFVKTLTAHSAVNPFGGHVQAYPFSFEHPEKLTESLKGATTFYNTYWIRFPRGGMTYEKAVENTRILIRSAKDAGIRRFVHVSITNASVDSPLPYFREKGIVEKAVVDSGLSYAIIRPTVIFGTEGILINNIAWMLRRFPVFAVMGKGDYRIQPIFVEDMARICIDSAREAQNLVVDAVGPETYRFDELVKLIARSIGSRSRIIHMRPSLAYMFSRLIGLMLGDVVLTWDEVEGLLSNLLVSAGGPTGTTLLSEWLTRNAGKVGTNYASEIKRHYQ